jgi:hypothetical protein
MQVDGAPGEWSPTDFGQDDKRTFARCTRGELTPVAVGNALSGAVGGGAGGILGRMMSSKAKAG